jgi:hypothetical protein
MHNLRYSTQGRMGLVSSEIATIMLPSGLDIRISIWFSRRLHLLARETTLEIRLI